MKHLIVSWLLTMVLVGCSQRPTNVINTANESMKKAYSAKTYLYAPLLTKRARARYQQAEAACAEQDKKFALFRSYGASRWTYEEAAQLFDSATMSHDYVDTSIEYLLQYMVDKTGKPVDTEERQ